MLRIFLFLGQPFTYSTIGQNGLGLLRKQKNQPTLKSAPLRVRVGDKPHVIVNLNKNSAIF
jgi:hypothetical protein